MPQLQLQLQLQRDARLGLDRLVWVLMDARVSRALDVVDGAQEVGGFNTNGDLARTEMLLQSCRIAPLCCPLPPCPPDLI